MQFQKIDAVALFFHQDTFWFSKLCFMYQNQMPYRDPEYSALINSLEQLVRRDFNARL